MSRCLGNLGTLLQGVASMVPPCSTLGGSQRSNHQVWLQLCQHEPQTVWAEIHGLKSCKLVSFELHIALSHVNGCCAHDMLPTFYKQDFNGRRCEKQIGARRSLCPCPDLPLSGPNALRRGPRSLCRGPALFLRGPVRSVGSVSGGLLLTLCVSGPAVSVPGSGDLCLGPRAFCRGLCHGAAVLSHRFPCRVLVLSVWSVSGPCVGARRSSPNVLCVGPPRVGARVRARPGGPWRSCVGGRHSLCRISDTRVGAAGCRGRRTEHRTPTQRAPRARPDTENAGPRHISPRPGQPPAPIRVPPIQPCQAPAPILAPFIRQRAHPSGVAHGPRHVPRAHPSGPPELRRPAPIRLPPQPDVFHHVILIQCLAFVIANTCSHLLGILTQMAIP